MMSDHKGDLVFESAPGYCSTDGNCSQVGDIIQESSFFLVARTEVGYQKGISVRALKDQYGLTDLATYQHQARHAINMQRMTTAPGVSTWSYATNGTSSGYQKPATKLTHCCWNRDSQSCTSSSQCDPGGEGCILSGTTTKKYGTVTCSTAPADAGLTGAEGEDLRKGGSFEGYVMTTEPEPRALESSGEFLKAEGSRGWRGGVE